MDGGGGSGGGCSIPLFMLKEVEGYFGGIVCCLKWISWDELGLENASKGVKFSRFWPVQLQCSLGLLL